MRLFLRALPIAIVALAPTYALAADYDPPIYVEEAEEYVPVEIGSGWYLRGDVGYAFSTTAAGTYTYRTFTPLPATYGNSVFTTGEQTGDISGSLGFGYQYNQWLRADLTADVFQGRFGGTTTSATPCVDPVAFPAFAGTTCRSEDSSRYSAVSVMANGYVDLGTFAGLTPYAGAGVGVTYMQWGNLTNNAFCVNGGAACPPPGGVVTTATHPGLDSWRLTYALMGGVAYDISTNLKLDLGYKYTKVEGGPMFGFDAASTTAGAIGIQGRDPGFDRHEVRVGLRYALW